jgi:hypothetical protein
MCAICKIELNAGAGDQPKGNAAHIVALSSSGPRADPSLSTTDRNLVENLIMLCPNCHDKVDGNEGKYTVRELQRVKTEHEHWTASLRQAGSRWNVRFQTVDYVNLPRILALPGGDRIWDVARDIGIDDRVSFAENGMRAGLFVGRVQSIFESIDARAVTLDVQTVTKGCPVTVVCQDR